jgi:antitoxin (DNA-binding transcriptional repressor) of toxin-antitoxin stability system
VKQGATIVVTEHGRRMARLVPEGNSFAERLEMLRKSSAVLWSGPASPKPNLRALVAANAG